MEEPGAQSPRSCLSQAPLRPAAGPRRLRDALKGAEMRGGSVLLSIRKAEIAAHNSWRSFVMPSPHRSFSLAVGGESSTPQAPEHPACPPSPTPVLSAASKGSNLTTAPGKQACRQHLLPKRDKELVNAAQNGHPHCSTARDLHAISSRLRGHLLPPAVPFFFWSATKEKQTREAGFSYLFVSGCSSSSVPCSGGGKRSLRFGVRLSIFRRAAGTFPWRSSDVSTGVAQEDFKLRVPRGGKG